MHELYWCSALTAREAALPGGFGIRAVEFEQPAHGFEAGSLLSKRATQTQE